MIGTANKASATKVLLLGSGELGKELVIELQRYGVEVMACDSYSGAPAMQVAHHSRVFSMLDGEAIRKVVDEFEPTLIVPEVEAIATKTLVELEQEGKNVIPSAKAAYLTMNREGIRCLVVEDLGVQTSPYAFADTFEDFKAKSIEIGFPCITKPVMSSSGKGQSTMHSVEDVQQSWDYAQSGGRAGAGRVIIEGFIDFDYEITLLTIRHKEGTSFCSPIGHRQEDGDYRESWQPTAMSEAAILKSQEIAKKVTDALGGQGIFGVELFIKGDEVWFSELSPRPHDTGLVTLVSQNLSQFALHARAILGLPIPVVKQLGPSASSAFLVEGHSKNIAYHGIDDALKIEDVEVRIFAKPEVAGRRRMGVALAKGDTIENAKAKAITAQQCLSAELLE